MNSSGASEGWGTNGQEELYLGLDLMNDSGASEGWGTNGPQEPDPGECPLPRSNQETGSSPSQGRNKIRVYIHMYGCTLYNLIQESVPKQSEQQLSVLFLKDFLPPDIKSQTYSQKI